jgi:phage tail-like protein
MAARKDPYRGFRFRVEIDGITQAGFTDATIPDSTTDPVEYREGTDAVHPRKLSGQTKYGNISLKWGLTDSMDLYNWRKQVVEKGASSARKNLSVILVDEEGSDKARWNAMDAWPTKYDCTDPSAKGAEVLIESLDLVCEEVVRVQ